VVHARKGTNARKKGVCELEGVKAKAVLDIDIDKVEGWEVWKGILKGIRELEGIVALAKVVLDIGIDKVEGWEVRIASTDRYRCVIEWERYERIKVEGWEVRITSIATGVDVCRRMIGWYVDRAWDQRR